MGPLALGLLVAFGVVCIGVRGVIHYRQTGESPFLRGGVSGPIAVTAFSAPMVAAAILDTTGGLSRLVDSTGVGVAGAVLAVGGIIATMWAQLAMGESWRVGIDPEERTSLVTTGPYARVRNPIYTAMFAFTIGVTLLVPNVLAVASAVVVVIAFNVVVRTEEEPYLLSAHGAAFTEWKAHTGRFLPSLRNAA